MSGHTAPEASVYRCADCGHGKHLTAWGGATVFGPLAADGDIAEDTRTEVYQVHEDSIQCPEHPDAVIEKCIDGEWCRWWRCPWCGGEGRDCDYVTMYDGWRPITEIAAMPPLPGVVHGHTFSVVPSQPAMRARCRICRCPVTNKSCLGDRHNCPAAVPEGTPGAHKVYAGGWHCYQPGRMNADFTSWTCRAGHVITRDSHDHPQGQCIIPQDCPWEDLVPAVPARAAS